MAKKQTPAAPEQTAVELKQGDLVEFLGYPDDVPEDDRILVKGEHYEFIEFADQDGTEVAFLRAPNPEFDPKKKENAESNPKFFEVDALPDEIAAVVLDETDGAAVTEAPAAEAKAAEAKPARGRAAAKTATETAPAAEAAAPAKGKGKAAAGKGKAAEAAAPAKGKEAPKAKGKAAAKEQPEEQEEDQDAPIELEGEDETVLQMIEENQNIDDLIAAAQGLESDAASIEYRLGGVLFHLRNGKRYLEVEGGEANKENGGWALFVMEHFNLQYRKAMNLIEIYVHFTQSGLPNPAEEVAKMGWTKASKIAKFLTHPDFVEGKTAAQIAKHQKSLLAAANENSSDDLSKVLEETLSIGGGSDNAQPSETRKRVTWKMRFYEEDATLVNTVLAQAQERLALPSIEDTLLMILGDYAAQQDNGSIESSKEAAAEPTAAPGNRRRAKATA